MSTFVHRFVLAGTQEDVPFARHKVIDQVRKWGVSMDDETDDAIRLVASELITNAVVHGEGPVTVTLQHRPGHLVIDVLDGNSLAPQRGCAQADDESGRGLALVGVLASRCSWEPTRHGKRVWAEITLPMPVPAVRTSALRSMPDPDLAFRPTTATSATWIGPSGRVPCTRPSMPAAPRLLPAQAAMGRP
ncbi:ATP-binding protein [Streptomyces sp. NPDC001663]|uniref:ATP-binding protein n=1 Tax=Streptomyces sp. NPDC001663 TaxID=3364597 RepID=UPI003684B33E